MNTRKWMCVILMMAGLVFTNCALAQTWTGLGDRTWTDADSLDFSPQYNNGNIATFTTNGAGTVTIDPGGVTPGAVIVTNTTTAYTFTNGCIGGTGSLTKRGAGTLNLASSNSFTGGIFINGGTINLPSGATAAHLGDSGNVITFTGNGTNNFTSNTTLSQGFAVNEGVTATLSINTQTITINNSLTGSGTLEIRSASTGGTCSFTGTNNTFSGDILLNNSNVGYPSYLTMASLADTPGRRIKMGRGQGYFTYGGGAVVPLVLSNRQIELLDAASGGLLNSASNPDCTVTVNTDLLVSGSNAGARTFIVGGGNTGKNKFLVVIPNGNGPMNLEKKDGGLWIVPRNNTYSGTTTVRGGTLILSGTNTYTGATTIYDNGILVIQNIANYGTSCSLGAATTGAIGLGLDSYSGILVYRGGAAECDRTVKVNGHSGGNGGSAIILNNGNGDLTFTANPFNTTYANANSLTRTLTLGGTRGGTIAGVLQNHSATCLLGITKRGSGTWTLQGDNTNTGASSAAGGGNLVLDYTTNTGSKIADTNLTFGGSSLGGSTITLKGGIGLTEMVFSTTLSVGASRITRDTGNTVLQMNAITRQAGGNISFIDGAIATTDTANNNGILGGWATIGSDWAMNSSGADGAITALPSGSYTGALPSSSTGSTTANYTLSGNQTQTGTSDLNAWTLKITGAGTLALAGTTIQIQNGSATALGGILYAGGVSDVYNITADAAKGIKTTGTQDLIINTVSGTLNVSAKINIGDSTRTLLKAGAGTLVVSSANGYTGVTYVNEGALRLANATAAGTPAGGIQVQYGAALELSNNISVGAKALALDGNGISSGGALRNVLGDNTYGGVITLGGGGARINSDSGTLTLANSINMTALQTLTFGGSGNIIVSNAVFNTIEPVVKDGTGTLALVISDSSTSKSLSGLALNGGALELKFAVAPSATVPALKIDELTFSGTPTIKLTATPGLFTSGITYPLLTVTGTVPGITPNVELSGVTGTLKWVGNTLVLVPPPAGTLIFMK